MIGVVTAASAGAAVLTGSSASDRAAGGSQEVVVPEQSDLQDPASGPQGRGAPRVTCERGGEKIGCVWRMHRLVSASSAPDPHSWRVAVTSDLVVATGPETIVALSRSSGKVQWRKGFEASEGPVGGPWVLGGETIAVQSGRTVRALSVVDGSELWSVDDARVAFRGRDAQLATMFTVESDDGRPVLAAREPDGTVRWRQPIVEAAPSKSLFPEEVRELGSVAFVVRDGPDHDLSTIALDSGDGTERWRRADSRSLHASADVAVMLDVDREVDEQPEGTIRVSESPAAVVGLDVADGTQRWRREITGQHRELGIVGDILVTRGGDELTGDDLATGERLWQREVAADERVINAVSPWGPPVSPHRRVLSFLSHERTVQARDPATGEVIWQTRLDELVGHMSTAKDVILGRVNDSTVVQLDPTTGQVRGTITSDTEGRPQFLAHDVLVDTEAGWVVLVDLPTTRSGRR